MLSLLYVGLFFQLGTPPSNQNCPTKAETENRFRQEIRLTDLAIDRTILRSFPVWEQKTGRLRPRLPAENADDSTSVVILHLWATWCGPCREEFAVWRDLQERLTKQSRGRLRIVHIAMQNEPAEMGNFVSQMGDKLPFGVRYFDQGARLAKNLRPALGKKREPPLPMTLWLDHERIVRHAMVGSIAERLPQVMETTAQLVRLVEQQESGTLRPNSTDDDNDVFSPQ